MATTAELADFIEDTSHSTLTDEVREEIKKRILDSVGIAIGAIDATPPQIMTRTVRELDEDGATSLWGTAERASPQLATMRNGSMVRYLDFMDAYQLPNEGAHPSNNVAPVLVTGEYCGNSGEELITALGIAYEIHYEIGYNAQISEKGWDHGTYVNFAAAGAASKLFGLDREKARNALGISGVGHNALRVTRTGNISMWKGCSAANAARNAVISTILAKNGMEGPKDVFEGKKGFKQAVSGDFEVDLHTDCRAVMKTLTKKYMAGTWAQTAISAVRELVDEERIDHEEIERIHVDTFKRGKNVMGGMGASEESGDRFEVQNREEADHSLPYTLAAMVVDRELTKEQYNAERWRDPDVNSLMKRISIAEDPALTELWGDGYLPSEVAITMQSGETHTRSKRYYEGHPMDRMDWDVIAAKFRDVTDDVYTPEQQNAIVGCVQNLEDYEASELIDLINDTR